MENCKEKIERLENELADLKKECLSECSTDRKFKIGDWVCTNHGEYPDYFSKEVGQITHFSYEYDKKGIAQFKYCRGGGWDDNHLRFAHPKEIEYAKSGLPFIFNNVSKEYDLVEINGCDFKIGDILDTSDCSKITGKQLISVLMATGLLNSEAKKHLSIIFEKLK